jgi:hypothetical protein
VSLRTCSLCSCPLPETEFNDERSKHAASCRRCEQIYAVLHEQEGCSMLEVRSYIHEYGGPNALTSLYKREGVAALSGRHVQQRRSLIRGHLARPERATFHQEQQQPNKLPRAIQLPAARPPSIVQSVKHTMTRTKPCQPTSGAVESRRPVRPKRANSTLQGFACNW